MTCLEKLKEQNPLFDERVVEDIIRSYCPFEWRIDYPPGGRCCHGSCKECWSQEIPEKGD